MRQSYRAALEHNPFLLFTNFTNHNKLRSSVPTSTTAIQSPSPTTAFNLSATTTIAAATCATTLPAPQPSRGQQTIAKPHPATTQEATLSVLYAATPSPSTATKVTCYKTGRPGVLPETNRHSPALSTASTSPNSR